MAARKSPAQYRADAERIARMARGVTLASGRTIEWTEVDATYGIGPSFRSIRVTFAGSGLAPFREARYTPAEVLAMIGAR